MLGAALSIGVLLALTGGGAAGTAPQGCTIPPQELARLLERLEGSVATAELPNPSVLLALNLAGAAGSNARQQLLKQLEEEAVKRAQKDMSSGEVALYTLALLSSCHSPQQVEALGLGVDLLRILQQKTDEEVASLDEEGVPLSTLYSVGLDVLALCVVGTGSYERAAIILAKQLLSPQSHLSVDTEAVVALALVCVHGRTELDAWEVRDLLEAAVEVVAVSFLYKQTEGNGLIGNVYSTGLAMQLLVAASEFYSPWEWDCAQAFSAVGSHNLQQPMAIAQALPALVGSSYLDAASLDCSTGAATATSVQLSLSPSTMTAQEAPLITVRYSITNHLKGQHFSFATTVRVPAGSALLAVLQAAEEAEPQVFSFQTKPTSWGPMVVSIHGLAASEADRTFWQFLSSGDALQEGVGTYKPQDGEHIQAVFSTY